MEREWFDIGRHIVEGVAKGESGLQIFLAILAIVFGMVAKPAFLNIKLDSARLFFTSHCTRISPKFSRLGIGDMQSKFRSSPSRNQLGYKLSIDYPSDRAVYLLISEKVS